jgi:NADPH-dependent curcumin reductase CurA
VQWYLVAGGCQSAEHVLDGFDQLVPAFVGMLTGDDTGRTLVRLASESARSVI